MLFYLLIIIASYTELNQQFKNISFEAIRVTKLKLRADVLKCNKAKTEENP